jgi:CheY-like chemotaxis protein
MTLLDRRDSDVVLVVDDVPDNLSVLHDALDESGYTVLVATSGEAALQRAAQAVPDIVLLDAMMPGMDGFEVAKRLKAAALTAHIPIIFMTGLTETEHLVAALEAGGVDYVTKPIKPKEVLARMGVHLQGARLARQTRNALDAFGYASIAVRASDGRLMWQTPLARELLFAYFGTSAPETPPEILQWLRRHLTEAERQIEPPAPGRRAGRAAPVDPPAPADRRRRLADRDARGLGRRDHRVHEPGLQADRRARPRCCTGWSRARSTATSPTSWAPARRR